MNKVILLVLENPLQNTPKQNKREIAQLLHVYGVLQEAALPPSSLPTSSKQRKRVKKFCGVNGCLPKYAEGTSQKYQQTHSLLL